MAVKPLDVTDSNFDSVVLKSVGPVLVDFWAPWCPPCRIVGPIVEEIAARLEGSLTVCKVNVDDNPAAAQTYAIRAVPTLILFKRGQIAKRLVGALPKADLEREIEAGIR
jgi:thioredoxin 1